MKKIRLVSSILVCLAFTVSTFAQNGNRAPSGCGSDFSANLYVNSGTNMTPDPQGPMYANGGSKNNKISVGFQVGNCSYDLIVQLNTSTRYVVTNLGALGIYNAKFFNFDRVASVPITTDTVAMNNFCNAVPPVNDNYAGCGTDSSGRRYVRRNVGIDLGDSVHSLRFQYSSIDSPNGNPVVAGTAFIKVYHPTATTWELVPENLSENGIGEIGAFLTNGARSGSPIVPFWFTVTRQ